MNPETICNRYVSLVGLRDVVILDVEGVPGAALRVHVELTPSAQGCPKCGVIAHVKDRRRVALVDLSMAGCPMRLVWLKRRFRCPEPSCPTGSWTEDEPLIASKRLMMTDRAGCWITEQVCRCARSVREVARELGCDWHTVNDGRREAPKRSVRLERLEWRWRREVLITSLSRSSGDRTGPLL